MNRSQIVVNVQVNVSDFFPSLWEFGRVLANPVLPADQY